MKKLLILFTALYIMPVSHIVIAEIVDIEDGMSHTFADTTYEEDEVRLDYNIANVPGTHVDVISGGRVSTFYAYHDASITTNGGNVWERLYAYDNATVTVMNGGYVENARIYDNACATTTGTGNLNMFTFTGYDNSTINVDNGSIFSLSAQGNSNITMTGGLVYDLSVSNNANIDLIGGQIDVGWEIYASDNGVIYLHGSNFEVNGQPLSYGDKLSDFVPLIEMYDRERYYGVVIGTLTDGSHLNNPFSIYTTEDYEGTADIIIIPEPATLLLLGIGVVMIRRRK